MLDANHNDCYEHLADAITLDRKSDEELIASLIREQNNRIAFQTHMNSLKTREKKILVKSCSFSSFYFKSQMLSKTFERGTLYMAGISRRVGALPATILSWGAVVFFPSHRKLSFASRVCLSAGTVLCRDGVQNTQTSE